jgi:capsular polysaccharide biosynthesis protein
VEPDKRSSPRTRLTLAITLFLGGLLGTSAALLKELSDRRVREASDLENLGGIPVLVKMPRIKAGGKAEKNASPMLARVEPSAI